MLHIEMDESGGNRVQIRVQEWAKKFHPDALRNRFRNFRKYVISAAIEERSLTSNAHKETSGSAEVAQSLHNCDISMNSILQDGKFDPICVSSDDEKCLEGERDESKLNMDGAGIPDVILLENSPSSQKFINRSCLTDGTINNSKLAISIDSGPRNKSPITVQEWVDSLPLTLGGSSREECEIADKNAIPLGECENDNLTLGAEAGCLIDKKRITTVPPSVNVTITGCQEPSEVESHCSSVDSLLEARKPDPEEVLLSLGFGGTASSSYLETGRIPKRFLQQSQLKGVDIEDFIRQQQDLIYTFESGYYGYRGLAGPSHSNPSVIVAKILEKLREHERETTSMTSYQLDFRKNCSLEKNPENPVTNKFSKVARNVLTKIRCTPTPSSVLSPDNRRWLDSQGSKSPEIARRLIIGQKSFTFGRDGDLIEASNHDNVNQRVHVEVDSNDDTNELNLKPDNVSQEQCNELIDNAADHTQNNCGNMGRRFTDSSTDLSVESIIMKNEFLRRSSFDDTLCSNLVDRRSANGEVNENSVKISNLKRLNHVDVDEPRSSHLCPSFSCNEVDDSRHEISNQPTNTRITLVANCSSGCETSDSDRKAFCCNSQYESSSGEISLQEELKLSGISFIDLNTNRGSMKKLKNVLTRCSSFEESCKDNSDDEVISIVESRFMERYESSEKADHYADSATESEFASYPNRSFTNKAIHRQYEELTLLESVLHNLGRQIKIITKDQFSTLSTEQRCAIQIQIIREALETYLNQMTEDKNHLELKNCLSAEVQKVADLLDHSSDASKLAVIVKQMTLLLQHQSQLSAQIKELSVVDRKPTSCHEMCEHILKRVHELELLVQQNAQELAQMKYHLLKKDNY